MSEIKTLEHLAVTDIEDLRGRVEQLEGEKAEYLQAKCDRLIEENARLTIAEKEWRELWNFQFKESKRLMQLCEKQQTELDRAIEQLAELEEQFSQLARKYNALALLGNVIKDFEPVKIGGDDGE